MKTILFTVFFVLFFALTAFAQPYLACDPQTGITQYTIEVKKGGAVIETATFAALADGSAKWDLTKYTSGAYTFRLRCADAKGWWSDWSDPFDATKPSKVGGVKIIP